MSHILIADDDQFLTRIISQAFEAAGYETSIANDGHEAVKCLKEKSPDLVLLDLLLPGIDGVNVLKFIRTRVGLERLPVFIVSNSEYFSGIVKAAQSEGATKFIHKGDLSPKGLVEEVGELVPPEGYTPPVSDESIQIDVQSPPKAAAAKGPKTVLIADDDRTIHGVLAFFFGQGGFKIESAFDGEQALKMARENPPSILVLDVTMPLKDGFETLAEWKQDPALSSIPVVMLTASQDKEKEDKALAEGATRYLGKPFSPDSLVDLAKEILGIS